MDYGKFEVSVLIGVAIFSSYVTYMFHCYWIRVYSLYSDHIHRLVRQLIVASGHFYLDDIYPEVGLIMIRAAENLMPPTQIKQITAVQYQDMIPIFERRALHLIS